MIDLLDSFDKDLMLLLNFDGGTWLDDFLYGYSGKWVWLGVYACILLKFHLSCRHLHAKWKSLGWLLLGTALFITLCDQISSGLIKPLVERPRPSHSPEIQDFLHYVNNYRGGRFGFVSSHAANSIGLAVWLCLLFRSNIFRTVILLWSVLTCYSRIYLGVHYPGDILGGLCVGIGCAFLVHALYRRFVPAAQQIPTERREPWHITCAILITCVLIALL